MDHEVCDVWTEFGVGEKPLVTVFVTAQEEGGCKKEKRSSRKYRHEDAHDAKSKGDKSEYCKNPLHPMFSPSGVDKYAQKKGKLITSHRYDLLPLLRSSPGGIQRELVV